MTNDHQQVATRAASDPELDRYHVLLDEEILPRLERPGRYVGPLEVRGIAPDGAPTRLALLWPSMPESHHVPRELAPWKAALETSLHQTVECAFTPPPDCAAALAEKGLCLFTRPGWFPLSRFSTLAVWMEHPAQILGLLSILRAGGIPWRREDRPQGPRLVAAGPATQVLAAVLPAWVDAIDEGLEAEDFARFVRDASTAGGNEALASASPFLDSPSSARGNPSAELRNAQPTEERVRPIVAAHRRPPWEQVQERFGGARWTRLKVWAASEALRGRLGLIPTGELIDALNRALAHESRVLEVDLAVGLPGETPADRAAIARLGRQLVKMAPRGERQLRFRLHACLEGERSRREWLEQARRDLAASRLKVNVSSVAEENLDRALVSAGREDAAVIEELWEAGAFHGDSDAAFLTERWASLADGHSIFTPKTEAEADAEASIEAGSGSVEAAATGLEKVQPIPATLDANGHPLPAPGAATPRAGRRDRWQRWEALVRREHPLRVAYEKRGRARHLSHQETLEILVEACRRGGVSLATSGVVSPRPKLSFGSPLPAGIEGRDEFVDLSLTHKPAGVAYALNEHLPEGLRVRWAEYLPPGDRAVHAPVARARFSARLRPEQLAQARERVERFSSASSWEIHRIKSDADLVLDLKAQVTNVHLVEGDDGGAELRFDLDTVDSTPRARPYEVLAALTGVDAPDVRTIFLCRVSLFSRGGDPMGSWKTPREILELAQRKSRQAMKRFA